MNTLFSLRLLFSGALALLAAGFVWVAAIGTRKEKR